MEPRKYEVLRDDHHRARDLAQERRDREQLEEKERSARKGASEQDRPPAQIRAEREFEVEKHKRYLSQQAAYEQRQQEAFDKARRDVESERYLKANDPREYGRLMNDKRRDAERDDHEQRVKQAWKERAEGRSDQSGHTREFSDASREQIGKKWGRELSDSARQSLDQSRSRDQQERERADRSR